MKKRDYNNWGLSHLDSKKRRRLRRRVLERDGGRCTECGATERLQLHHVIPYRISQCNKPDNLLTLCDACHRALHKRARKAA